MIDIEQMVKQAYLLAVQTVEALERVKWASSTNMDEVKRSYTNIYLHLLITHQSETYVFEALQAYVSFLKTKTYEAPLPPRQGQQYTKHYNWWCDSFLVEVLNEQAIEKFVLKEINYLKACETQLIVHPENVTSNTKDAYYSLRKQLVPKALKEY